jgi:hypothetical protein
MAKRTKVLKKIRQNALVRFKAPLDAWDDYPFTKFKHYLFLGETAQMPGHCTVVDIRSGNIYVNYHTEDFEEVPAKEC